MHRMFEAHGTLDLFVKDRILRLEGTGPWNLESLDESGEEADPMIELLAQEPWAVLVIMHGECIYVHAAGQRLSEIVRAEKQRNRIATAILVNDCDSPNFAKQHIGEIYQNAGEHYEFFDDVDTAEIWLKQQLAKAAKD
ncbi:MULTISPECIES: hypothetical protein [Alteromonadaceae]|uniref:hypothetical protein n=1 Tax=Alteromonadaceae TaxID=72275 RepID=UPI001C088DA9|nr:MULTISPECIES: hypothetical protein [Aliiglaciecola]MBU2877465.1 hypothetical protein [Aliiglaciecola lipolytica]MDO6711048.1 hypothetical protein [Aliiglaciecola sp. 2_MG-2023]MDO6751962.1 hypothetical protein [Aliiglaciecola sp. 1_MG-2023]